jgi:hypothetical protein
VVREPSLLFRSVAEKVACQLGVTDVLSGMSQRVGDTSARGDVAPVELAARGRQSSSRSGGNQLRSIDADRSRSKIYLA